MAEERIIEEAITLTLKEMYAKAEPSVSYEKIRKEVEDTWIYYFLAKDKQDEIVKETSMIKGLTKVQEIIMKRELLMRGMPSTVRRRAE